MTDAGTGGVPLNIDREDVESVLCGHSVKAPAILLPPPLSTSCISGCSSFTSANAVIVGGASSSTSQRWQLDTASLDEAMDLAGKCKASEAEGPSGWSDDPWDKSMKLRPILCFVAPPDFALPARFEQAMDTCVACLLHAPEGHLQRAFRMAELLESHDVGPLLRYLEWLEPAIREVSSKQGSNVVAPVPERVHSALSSWPSECALLRQRAAALLEGLLKQAPQHLRVASDWQQHAKAREAMQAQQTEECLRISEQLEAATSQLDGQLQEGRGQEGPKVVRSSQDRLRNINRLAAELLSEHKEKWAQALRQYEAHALRMDACRTAMGEARRQVHFYEQALSQTLQRFTEVASHLVVWTSVLVPKLRLLEQHRGTLRSALDLQRRLPVLEREKIDAEDEQDAAATELRKHRRHASVSRQTQTAAGAALERQILLREKHAEERARQLDEEFKEVQRQLEEFLARLPFVVVAEDIDEHASQRAREDLSPEERLALKLAELQETHEVVALQVSEVQAERDRVLAQVEERRADEALRKRMEPDFMCPIMHERMNEPVLAADGHTYERQAIERWLQMHNTSPMTGAPLAHRYLTENFALRHLISSYEAGLAKDSDGENSDEGVSTLDDGDL